MGRPGLIVTGATGFLGRHLVAALGTSRPIWAISRGSPALRGVFFPSSVRWISADIARQDDLRIAFEEIDRGGGADVLVHLAGHYDFTGEPSPEYERTNVRGTRLVLEAAREHAVRDVVFSSSVAACAFPREGEAITEDSRPDGDTPYAASKRAGEEMLAEYRAAFRGWTVRFGALFSDWCEYEPLFRFLEMWLSRLPRSRVLAGRGRSAVPYLHVRDAAGFLRRLIERRVALDASRVLIASPDGATSHLELFDAATAAHHGQRLHPRFLPAPLCRVGIRLIGPAARAVGAAAWERPWMGKMIDLRLDVRASRTREALGWAPTPRLGILRRMPFLIQNRKSFPADWQRHNHAVLKSLRLHENLLVHRRLQEQARQLVDELTDYLLAPERGRRFPGLQGRGRERQRADNAALFAALAEAVLTGEKAIFRDTCRRLARRGRSEGLSLDELTFAVDALADLCILALTLKESGESWALALYDHVTMTGQFGVDAIHDVFEEVNGP